MTNTIGQLSLLMLVSLAYLSRKDSAITKRVRERVIQHQASYIEKKYRIKLIYPPGGYTSDLFWRDYFQVPGFLFGNEIVIDVGASIGDFAIVLVKAFGANKVIAVEPSRELYLYLVKNIRLNNMQGIVIPLNIALYDREKGTITLYGEKEGPRLLSIKGRGLPSEYPVTTLDRIASELGLPSIDLVKIDTEGSELAILRGAIKSLRIYKPKLIVEVHSRKDRLEIIRMLAAMDYELIHEKTNFPMGLGSSDYVGVLYFQHRGAHI